MSKIEQHKLTIYSTVRDTLDALINTGSDKIFRKVDLDITVQAYRVGANVVRIDIKGVNLWS